MVTPAVRQGPRRPGLAPHPFFKRGRGIGKSLNSGLHIGISFLSALCPFGVTFVHFKTPLWYFLHLCGFSVRAGPYHGRRMVLTHPQRLASMLRQYRSAEHQRGRNPESFFAIRMDPVLRASLVQLFDACLHDPEATTAVHCDPFDRNGDDQKSPRFPKLLEQVESFIDLASQEHTLLVKDVIAASVGASTLHLLPFSLPFSREMFEIPFSTDDQSTTELSLPMEHAGGAISSAIRTSLCPELRHHATPSTTDSTTVEGQHALCEPVTYVFSLPSDAKGGVSRALHEVLRTLSTASFSSLSHNVGEGVTIVICHLLLSVGAAEIHDVTCSIVRLVPDQASASLRLVLVRDHVLVSELGSHLCQAVVIGNAQLLSHQALHELRHCLETNARMKDVSNQQAGLLPRWTPVNGGVAIVCVGSFDSIHRGENRNTAAHNSTMFHLTVPTFDGTADLQHLPNAAREAFSTLIEVLTAASEDALPVTAVQGSTELCARESLVQSFLRSTRPIALSAVEDLLRSCPLGAGMGLLVPTEVSESRDLASWSLQQIVQELNQIKIQCNAPDTSGPAMARLEKLLNEVPLLKYIGVRHKDMVRFHNLEHAAVTDNLTEEGAPSVALQHSVEARVKQVLRSRTTDPDRALGVSFNVELVHSRRAELLGKDKLRTSLELMQQTSSVLFVTQLLPPRVAKGFRGVTVVACVHENTPLSVVERAVWDHIGDLLPPFVAAEELFRGCLCFPMDFVEFRGSIRKCIGVRLMVNVDLDEPATQAAEDEARRLLPQALDHIRRSSRPFAVESLPPSIFGLRPPPTEEIEQATITTEKSAVSVDDADAMSALLQLAQQSEATDPIADAASHFVCVNESAVLVYPNVVERRLQALAAVTVPDELICMGMRVLLHEDAHVIVVGAIHGVVEQHFPVNTWRLHTVVPSRQCVAFGKVEQFRRSSEALNFLCSKANPANPANAASENATAAAVFQKLVTLTECYISGQRVADVGLTKLPLVVLPTGCLRPVEDVNTTQVNSAKETTGLLAIVLPCCTSIGGRRAVYGYELPVVALPLVTATHCGVDYRFDGLYSGHTRNLLCTLARDDPFTDCTSRRLSRPVFREPVLSRASRESAALVRLAVSKAATIQTRVAVEAEGVARDPTSVLEEIDKYLCMSTQFTAAVFY